MAFIILGCAVALDFHNGKETCTMFAIPFVAGLIGWKQYQDSKKQDNG